MTEWHIYVIAAAAWLLTYVKIPIKKLTAKLITDDTVRKLVNNLIILLPILFSFLGVAADMLIFGWEAADIMTAFVNPGLSAAGIAIIIYNAVKKFFTGKTDTEYDGLVKLLSSSGMGDNAAVKKILDGCLSLADGDIGEYIAKLIPGDASEAVKSLISGALLLYIEKSADKSTKEEIKDGTKDN